jgi:hypothetical protein
VASLINSWREIIGKYKHLTLFAIGVANAFGAIWSFLWVLSSFSLAQDFCNNQFSLLHQSMRCRQPYIALLLLVFFLLAVLVCFVFGIRQHRRFKTRAAHRVPIQ